jgi:pimeloyl-ACP methyl ester carboxylesterase
MTLPSFTAVQSVYPNKRHNRSSPVMRNSGITGFQAYGSYPQSFVRCTRNDDDLSCCCYDPTRHDKPAKTGPIAVQAHLNDDGRVMVIERNCRAALKRAATRKAAFPLQGALPLGLSKNELQRRFARMQSHWISRTVAAITAIGLTLLLATGAWAQNARPEPTVVLVHGGFTDASAWDAVIDRLQDDGFPVIAPANPLRGVMADSAYLASVLNTLSGPLILVGASEGGIVISNAPGMMQNPQNVQALVFVAAFIPDVGERGQDLTPLKGSLVSTQPHCRFAPVRLHPARPVSSYTSTPRIFAR